MSDKLKDFDFESAAEYLRTSNKNRDARLKKFEDFVRALDTLCREHGVDLNLDTDAIDDIVLVVRTFDSAPTWHSHYPQPAALNYRNELKD